MKKNVIHANLRTKCVEVTKSKKGVTFENLHLFGFSPEFYDQGKPTSPIVKSLLRGCDKTIDRLYQPRSIEIDDRSEILSKMIVGLLCFETMLVERKKTYLPFFRADRLDLAVQDFLSSPKMMVFYNSPYLESNTGPNATSMEGQDVAKKRGKPAKSQGKGVFLV